MARAVVATAPRQRHAGHQNSPMPTSQLCATSRPLPQSRSRLTSQHPPHDGTSDTSAAAAARMVAADKTATEAVATIASEEAPAVVTVATNVAKEAVTAAMGAAVAAADAAAVRPGVSANVGHGRAMVGGGIIMTEAGALPVSGIRWVATSRHYICSRRPTRRRHGVLPARCLHRFQASHRGHRLCVRHGTPCSLPCSPRGPLTAEMLAVAD